jgi:hypothetical protein
MRKIMLIFILIMVAGKLYSQSQRMIIKASNISADSALLEVQNVSLNDTLFFSIYKQQLFGKKWVSNNYDVFCDVENPNTTVARILPNETLTFRLLIGTTIYSGEVTKKDTRKTKGTIVRYMFLTTIVDHPPAHKLYSNTILSQ